MTSKITNPWTMCAVGFLALAMATGCGPVVVGNGKMVTETKEVALFTQLEVGGGIDITVTEGPLSVLTLSGEENVLPQYEVKVVDGILSIGPKRNTSIQETQTVTGTITVPRLDVVHASGATRVTLGAITSPNNVDIQASGASKISTGLISAPQIHLAASGSSDLEIRGVTPLLDVEASGASKVVASGLASEVLSIAVSGSSNLSARASKEARGEASGASKVVVVGAPALQQISTSGSSSVTFP
jgi:hypothetical protein